MKAFFFISLVLIAAGSCTFRQDIKFNKNWSGEIACIIDMSSLNTMLDSSDNELGDTENLLSASEVVSRIKILQETPGIKKVKAIETEKGIYTITYTFSGIKALNKSGNIIFSEEGEPKDFVYFELKDKKTLYFTTPFTGTAENNGDDEISQNFGYELTMAFPRKIASLETKSGAVLSEDKKQVSFKSDINTMTTAGFEPGMLIRFEK